MMNTPDSTSTPALSVVVVMLGGRAYLCRWLESFTRQAEEQDIEVLVPCDDRLSDVPSLQSQFPMVRFLCAQGQHTYAELRALGVRESRGAIVAITEDHCTPEPGWCRGVLQAQKGSHAAVGGAVCKAGPDTVVNWAIYLADFSRYMNPVPEGPSAYLTDCNVSYKRSALASISEVWADEFHETLVNSALASRGEGLWLTPKIIVGQQRSLSLGAAVRERCAFGRLFASTRVAQVSSIQRAMYASLSWVLPVILVARVLKNVIARRRHLDQFFRVLPALMLLSLIWSFGEFVGYLTGGAPLRQQRADLTSQRGRRATA
jgi:hypothetical protein